MIDPFLHGDGFPRSVFLFVVYGGWVVVDEGGEGCEFREVCVYDVEEFLSRDVVKHVGEIDE